MTISTPGPLRGPKQLLGQTTQTETGNLPDETRFSIRWDVHALVRFLSESPMPPFFGISDSQVYKAIELFWSQFRPTRLSFDSNRPLEHMEAIAEALFPEHERIMLQSLESLHRKHQVNYQPDSDDSEVSQILDRLTVQVHIAAGRAIRLKRSDGLSEEVVDCLKDAEQAVARIEVLWLQLAPGDGFGPFTEGMPVYYISTGAVAALTFAELGRVSKALGNYSKALNYIAKAAAYFDRAVYSNKRTLSERYSDEERETKAYQEDASSQNLLRRVFWRGDARPSANYSKSSLLPFDWSSLQFPLVEVADLSS